MAHLSKVDIVDSIVENIEVKYKIIVENAVIINLCFDSVPARI